MAFKSRCNEFKNFKFAFRKNMSNLKQFIIGVTEISEVFALVKVIAVLYRINRFNVSDYLYR